MWVLAMGAVVLVTRERTHRVPRGRLFALGAFLCIAMLLFPVISASDDLHTRFELSDDAAWRHEKRGPGVVALIALVLACALTLPHPESNFVRVMAEHPAASDPGFLPLDLSRAPPQVL